MGFIVVYGLLGACGFYLMFQKAKKGPDLPSKDPAADGGQVQPT